MIFTKKDLKFLDLYSLCIDTKSKFGDKIIVESFEKEQKIVFSQSTKESTLITEFTGFRNLTNSKICFTTSILNSLIKSLPDDSEIELGETIKINKVSTYNIAVPTVTLSEVKSYLALLNNPATVKNEINLVDLQKLSLVKSFTGDKGLDAVAIYDNYMIATNKIKIASIIKNSNTIPTFFVSKLTLTLLLSFKIDNILINDYVDNKFYSFNIGPTQVIIPKEKYLIPNFMSDKNQKYFDHPNVLTINKIKFFTLLQRIETVTKTNYDNRVFLTFQNNAIVIENRDSAYAKEILEVEVPKVLVGTTIKVFNTNLLASLNLINTENCILKVLPGASTIALMDESKEKIYIHVLYK